MRKYGILGAALCLAAGVAGCSGDDAAPPPAASTPTGNTVKFIATDEPGPWFKCVGNGCVPAETQSLAIIKPGDTVQINNGTGTTNVGADTTNTVHTFTSLLYPTGAANMPFDQPAGAFRGIRSVKLDTTGLYVFVCKLHPFMLAAVIVDDPATTHPTKLVAGKPAPAYDLGETFNLVNGINDVPTTSDLATRLLRTFWVITNPANYQDHNIATNPTLKWHINYPAGVDVRITGGAVVDLKTTLETRYPNDTALGGQLILGTDGVGEVWVDLEYEKTAGKSKPGTATAVDVATWAVTKRVTLPGIDMNNPHNMWASADQSSIYQTQWFGDKLTVFNRTNGTLIRNITVGDSPAHVMTRVDTDDVHVSLNGEGAVLELGPLAGGNIIGRRILTQAAGNPAQPHAHWMSHDGQTMVTPNSNTNDSTQIDIPGNRIQKKTDTGWLPIATGMMPDATKYYVSNYLDSTITCISIAADACNDGAVKVATKNIPLLLGGTGFANYDPIGGTGFGTSGALPIQTPVSPDGKFVVTANTLTATITIIDTATDTLVAVLSCSAGCHGVNFGAKLGGGYYAYVSSKFSNDLIVVNLNGAASTVVGRIILAASATPVDDTSGAITLAGMGGQGVLPVPNVYNGWAQKLPKSFCDQLSPEQRSPIGAPVAVCP